MKIKYDYKIFNSQEYGGISKYFFYLFINISKLNKDTKIITFIHRNRYIKNLTKKIRFGFFISSKNIFLNRLLKFVSFIYDYINSKYRFLYKLY